MSRGTFAQAVRINNGVRNGLSSSLHTRDVDLAFQAMQQLDNDNYPERR